MLYEAPISLNTNKTKAYSFDDIRRDGIKALGSFLGPTAKQEAFLNDKISDLAQITDRIRHLPKQHALLLLRSSTSTLLRYLPRTIASPGLEHVFREIDRLILSAVAAIRSKDSLSPLDAELTALPTRDGGLGIALYEETALHAYTASKDAATLIITSILGSFDFGRDLTPLDVDDERPIEPLDNSRTIYRESV